MMFRGEREFESGDPVLVRINGTWCAGFTFVQHDLHLDGYVEVSHPDDTMNLCMRSESIRHALARPISF